MMSRMSFLNLKATAVATVVADVSVLAATAEAAGSYYIPTPATPDFLLSPIFLWVTANVIIVWLVSSSRRRGRATNDTDTAAGPSSSDGGEVVVPAAVDGSFVYSSSEYEASSDAPPVSERLQEAREARAARRSDRPRVRRKPAEPAGLDAPRTPSATAVVADGQRDDEPPRDERRRGQAQEERAPAVSVDDDEDDVSMDSLWASIVQRRAARPVVVQKSESWGNEELPRLQRVAETAAARRQGVRKSVSAVAKAAATATAAAPTTQPPPEPQTGWRTRDVLVSISPDELLRRAESFIRRQREHLRLQRQESEQRQQLLLQRRRVPAPPASLIRV